ncbi:hypothetical protein Tco_0427668 [Tanacetum coccineum]
MNELNKLRDQAYENSLIYKEKTKRIHDSKIKSRVFNVGDRVLLFNSRLKIFSGKPRIRWTGPFTVTQVFPYGTVELSQTDGPNFKDSPDFEASCARGFVLRSLEFQILNFIIGIQYLILLTNETDIREKDEKSSKNEQNRAQNGKAWKSQSQIEANVQEIMSSASSAVTYTSVHTDSEPGRVFWGADEEISDGGSDFLMEGSNEFLEHDDSIPPGVDGIYDSEGDTVYLEELLSVINSDPNLPPSPVCEINVPEEIKSSCEDPPDLELKDLPSHLESQVDPLDQEKDYLHLPLSGHLLCRMPFGFMQCTWAVHSAIFIVKEGIVLGHKISKSGIEVVKSKVDVIAKLPHPTTVKVPLGQRKTKSLPAIHYEAKL